MTRPSLRGLRDRLRRRHRAESQPATQLTVFQTPSTDSSLPPTQGLYPTNNPIALVGNQGQALATPSSAPPLSTETATDPEALPIPISDSQPNHDVPEITQARQETEARNAPALFKPYASSAEMWKEALGQLDELARHNIENLAGELDGEATSVKSLAVLVQEQLEVAFKSQTKDRKSERIMQKSLGVLAKFVSAVDIAVSFDPVHAALPWAAVRSVLVLVTSNSDLKGQLIAGIATVASLLAQCDVYQQLYLAPDPALRPPEPSMSMLKNAIIQTYAKAQLFVDFAIEQQRSKVRLATAAFRVGDAESHVNELSKREKEMIRASDTCERHCNLSNRSAVQELLHVKADFFKIFQDQIDLLMDRIDSREQVELLEWISRIPHGQHHNRVKEARTKDTCQWLLQHDKFREWEDTSSSTILWLQGSPGAGKTFLVSKVVDHQRDMLEISPKQEGFAFFYCDRNEEQRRQPLSVLQSYVRQLSTTVKNPNCIRKQLQDCCRKARANGSDLGFEACREQLLESIHLYSQTTLVLDALDECEPQSRGRIVEVVEYLISRSKNDLKVFISSRPDRDIRDRFSKTPNIEIQATNNEEDIQEFVREKIVQHGNWQGMSQNLQDNIIQMLFTKSQGMFQWAFLQINELLNLETESAIRSRLGSLPADLKIAYDEIYKKIMARDRHDRALADRAFKWVACSFEPLTSKTLLSLIRLDSDTTALALSNPITESQLLHLCNNLLVVDSQQKVWRFSHLSVAEYFEANHWDLRTAHCHAASVSLKGLMIKYTNTNLDEIESLDDLTTLDSNSDLGSLSENSSIQEQQPVDHVQLQYHATRYSTQYWLYHVRKQETQNSDSLLAKLLKSFLGSPTESSLQYRAWVEATKRVVHGNPDPIWVSHRAPATTPLFGMCSFSLYHILLDWWEHAEFDIRAINSLGGSLLSLAAVSGCAQICKNLIRRGILVNMQLQHKEYGSALAAAVQRGNCEVAELLIAEGADVNMQLQHEEYGSALVTASAGRCVVTDESCMEIYKAIKLLIAKGADINMQVPHGKYGSALAAAARAYYENSDVVKLLIAEGADVNMQLQHRYYGSALAAAAAASLEDWYSNGEAIGLLIAKGADVNMQLQHGWYGSALAAAVSNYNSREGIEKIKVLLASGADVNMQLQSGGFGSVLIHAVASYASSLHIIKYLLSNTKVKVNQQVRHGRFGTALAAAAFYRQGTYVDILIEAGADANLEIQHGEFRTATEAARADATGEGIRIGQRYGLTMERGAAENYILNALSRSRREEVKCETKKI
ncbi:hypothetical protein F4680DRAFT_412804 [Xylaria scruposa]|nr:hypothetical protein F4680DRAFT_412804 [Xylaria scruposa]